MFLYCLCTLKLAADVMEHVTQTVLETNRESHLIILSEQKNPITA